MSNPSQNAETGVRRRRSSHSSPDPETGVSRRRFLQSTAAGGLWLAAGGLSLTAGSCTKSDGEIFNPDGVHVLWIAQTISGVVNFQGDPLAGASITLEISNNAGTESELWFPQGTLVSAISGYYEFKLANGGFYLIQPPINDPALTYNAYLRLTATKSGVGFARTLREVQRRASRTPPVGNLSPYQLQQNLALTPV